MKQTTDENKPVIQKETKTKKAVMVVMSEHQMTLLRNIIEEARRITNKSASPEFDRLTVLFGDYDEEIKELISGTKTSS